MNYEIVQSKNIKGCYISIMPCFYEDWGDEFNEDSIHVYDEDFRVPGYLISLYQNQYNQFEITYLGRRKGNLVADLFEEFGMHLKNHLDLEVLVEKHAQEDSDKQFLMKEMKQNPTQLSELLIHLAKYFRHFLNRSEVISIVGF